MILNKKRYLQVQIGFAADSFLASTVSGMALHG